jgi:hypothetical protein
MRAQRNVPRQDRLHHSQMEIKRNQTENNSLYPLRVNLCHLSLPTTGCPTTQRILASVELRQGFCRPVCRSQPSRFVRPGLGRSPGSMVEFSERLTVSIACPPALWTADCRPRRFSSNQLPNLADRGLRAGRSFRCGLPFLSLFGEDDLIHGGAHEPCRKASLEFVARPAVLFG